MKHTIETVEDAKKYLFKILSDSSVSLTHSQIELCEIVLKNPKFWIAPAAAKKHHAWAGGLAVHTAQVLSTALDMVASIPDAKRDLIVVAVIWHDYKKIDSYEKINKIPGTDLLVENIKKCSEADYSYTQQAKLIGHLAHSYAEFYRAAQHKMTEYAIQQVSHMMLAHHGRNEWGTPIEPQTVEAWAIHAADMMSSHFVHNYYLNRSDKK